MMGQDILFVTYADDAAREGFDYAIDLAKMTRKGIFVLLLERARGMLSRFEDLMTAVTFAEANQADIARQYLHGADKSRDEGNHRKSMAREIQSKCAASGVTATVQTATPELGTAVDTLLKTHRSIDMVLLSPTITQDGAIGARDLARLVKKAARPVVTMTRNESGTRNESTTRNGSASKLR